jgi:diguanylate cyclase (GGDEF)-like protein/PAS domain S-box-containing protein
MSQPDLNEQKTYFYDMPIDLFCVIDIDKKQILQANPSFEYILGWKEAEVINQPFITFVNAEEDIANIDKAFSKIKLGIHSLTFETDFKTKNNLVRNIDWKCYIDAENQLVYAIGRDITAHKENQKILIQQSHHDELTGLNNRQVFLTLLQQELSASFRYHHPTAIILLNIDHFKNFNQQYGTQKGDDCIKQIANILKTTLRRKTDFLARFENDEFIVMLTHNELEKALKSAEYLRENLSKVNKVTVSISVCALSEKLEKEPSIDQVIGALRQAMMLNRKNGENQINYVSNLA